MDRLEFGYSHGFTDGIQMVRRLLGESFFDDMRRHKRKWTAKTFDSVMKVMIDNREILRECPDSFIRCNNAVSDGFEVWKGR